MYFALDYENNYELSVSASKMIESGCYPTLDIIKEDDYVLRLVYN